MITLYNYGSMFGLPDPSPFVTKADVLLKMSRLPYVTDARGFGKAPKGKLPYIRDQDRVIADSSLIRFYLERHYSIDFDAGIPLQGRGIAWAIEKMCEEQLYWLIVKDRWLDNVNFEKGPAHFFDSVPALARGLVKKMVRRRIRQTLHLQGLGRHSTDELNQLGTRAVDALAAALGDQTYLMGSVRCGADATVFAFTLALLCPFFESPLRAAGERHANLVAYVERMKREFYPSSV